MQRGIRILADMCRMLDCDVRVWRHDADNVDGFAATRDGIELSVKEEVLLRNNGRVEVLHDIFESWHVSSGNQPLRFNNAADMFAIILDVFASSSKG